MQEQSYSTFSDSKCIFLIFRSYLNFLTEELVNPNKWVFQVVFKSSASAKVVFKAIYEG